MQHIFLSEPEKQLIEAASAADREEVYSLLRMNAALVDGSNALDEAVIEYSGAVADAADGLSRSAAELTAGYDAAAEADEAAGLSAARSALG